MYDNNQLNNKINTNGYFIYRNYFNKDFDNLNRSETSFNLKKRFDLIFNLFDVKNINDFNSKITLIKKQAKLEDNLNKLNIDVNKSSE